MADGFVATLSTDRPAFFVWVDAPGCRGEFDDNSFVLLPGRPRKLTFTPKDGTSSERFRATFRLTHLAKACVGGGKSDLTYQKTKGETK